MGTPKASAQILGRKFLCGEVVLLVEVHTALTSGSETEPLRPGTLHAFGVYLLRIDIHVIVSVGSPSNHILNHILLYIYCKDRFGAALKVHAY